MSLLKYGPSVYVDKECARFLCADDVIVTAQARCCLCEGLGGNKTGPEDWQRAVSHLKQEVPEASGYDDIGALHQLGTVQKVHKSPVQKFTSSQGIHNHWRSSGNITSAHQNHVLCYNPKERIFRTISRCRLRFPPGFADCVTVWHKQMASAGVSYWEVIHHSCQSQSQFWSWDTIKCLLELLAKRIPYGAGMEKISVTSMGHTAIQSKRNWRRLMRVWLWSETWIAEHLLLAFPPPVIECDKCYRMALDEYCFKDACLSQPRWRQKSPVRITV